MSNWNKVVGKTRIALAKLLSKLAKKKYGNEFECWPEDLNRNAPVYVCTRHDGVSWDGYLRKYGELRGEMHIYSYQSMATILKGPKVIIVDDGEVMAGI